MKKDYRYHSQRHLPAEHTVTGRQQTSQEGWLGGWDGGLLAGGARDSVQRSFTRKENDHLSKHRPGLRSVPRQVLLCLAVQPPHPLAENES